MEKNTSKHFLKQQIYSNYTDLKTVMVRKGYQFQPCVITSGYSFKCTKK